MDNVFIRTNPLDTGFNVAATLNIPANKMVKGLVGLEIEVEGNKFPKPEGYEMTHHPVVFAKAPGWSYVHDGSLRGDDNAEYLLTKPIPFDKLPKHLEDLWKALDEHGSVIEDSNRTSVHVHLNCQGFFLNRLTTFMALYFTFEEILTEWCGEHRVGNLFCLRAKDAPAIVSQIRRFIRSDGQAKLQDHHHYAALNGNALHKYGSLEVRTLRGVTDPTVIQNWVNILQRLYDLSGEIEDPREVCSKFSAEGPTSFFYTILGDQATVVRQGVSLTDEQINDMLYTGVRLAQDICYCRDWDKYQKIEIAPDPFGRDPKKIMKKLSMTPEQQEAALTQMLDEISEEYDNEYDYPEPDYDTDMGGDAFAIPPAPSMSSAEWVIQQLNAMSTPNSLTNAQTVQWTGGNE